MKTILISLAMALSSSFMAYTAVAQSGAKQQMPIGKVETSFVCFVNNKYMGKEQIPVEVGGRTYYGCCMGCVSNIKNNRKTRYAIDPLTEKEVDKATAYIVLKSDSAGDVMYFAKKANYKKYKKNADS